MHNLGIHLDTDKKESSWRDFQTDYIVKKKKKVLLFNTAKAIIGFVAILLLMISLFLFNSPAREMEKKFSKLQTKALEELPPLPEPLKLSKQKLNQIISNTKFINTDKNIFFVDTPEESYKITTSIDVFLQEFLLSQMEQLKKLTRGKPERIALVVMEADTGKIIAMTGFDLENPEENPCFKSDYPAASIFKIITAAAAVETLGYTPQTPLFFNGSKYTLYKRQLKDLKNKYSARISFSRAFAESVNPVFGKIGKNDLGKEKLDSYADAFGFNQVINSELPFVTGSFETNSSDYHLAELGCGFNHDTTISPVFGAMLISAIINSGDLMLPSIIEHVTGTDGKIIYQNNISTYRSAVRPETATTMIQLLEKTISKGTARKSFRGSSKDAVLSQLVIGGKTGSLYNKAHTVKYDWFTGFGTEKKGTRKIAISVVVGHRKYIGTRASTYAKMILKQYYKRNDATAQL